MPGIAVLHGPNAPDGTPLGFCMVCTAIGKFFAIASIRKEIEAHERSGTGTRTFPLEIPREYLQRAVAWALIPSMGVAGPCCWTHLTAVQPVSGGIIPAAPVPPGFGNGVPLLGQGG